MEDAAARREFGGAGISIDRLDLSCLVGNYIKLFSRQFPGKLLRSKVLSANENRVHVNSGGESGLLKSLVTNQKLVVQVPYKDQEISFKARLERTEGGRCYLRFEERAVPLSQRKFLRISDTLTVKLAALPVLTFNRRNLTHLRWVETGTINFSSGGVMISLPGGLERHVKLLLNVDIASELFPPLVAGEVRHCFQSEETAYRVGVEFAVRESVGSMFPRVAIDQLPSAALGYSASDREKLNKRIVAGSPLRSPAP
jgi:hypothetical protein